MKNFKKFGDTMGWGFLTFLSITICIMAGLFSGLAISIHKSDEELKIQRNNLTLETITNSAQSLCNFDDIDKQDACINRLIDSYKRVAGETK